MEKRKKQTQSMMLKNFIFYCCTLMIFILGQMAAAQDQPPPSQYLTGTEEKLEMVVHIWGEVKNPGEMKVAYNTNILELISKAGGPSAYANLAKVRLTRQTEGLKFSQEAMENFINDAKAGKIAQDKLEETIKTQYSQRILVYNLKDYLQNKKDFTPPIVLRPGDVVFVPHNSWYRWSEFVRVAQQIAVIASVYVWYLRAEKNI
jgi:hypothetical protein